ncbi:MAG TPA: peptidoglycan DD-metalloendopeptidase family protein [Usitatibacter sp.]|nr:peptidoglycan DD-metalloendopeptidase family protein [Usitatibacter sp.]
MTRLAALALVAVLAGCAAPRPAPVLDRGPAPAPAAAAPAPRGPAEKPLPTHTVQRGDTLVSIALQYGLDYRELAAWNGITNPAQIRVGQVLVLAPPSGMAGTATAAAPPPAPGAPPAPPSPEPGKPVATPLVSAGPPIEARPLSNTPALKVEPRGMKVPYSDKAMAEFSVPEAPAVPGTGTEAPQPPASGETAPAAPAEAPKSGTQKEDVDWMWPVKGKIIGPFSEQTKGIEIAGKRGAPVVAAASGRVIYADSGLRGLGKLVIIRHNDTWLSAYAHNDKILVKEQQEVRKGEKIAEMGSTDADRVELHFEIRRKGKPVDPARYLPPM